MSAQQGVLRGEWIHSRGCYDARGTMAVLYADDASSTVAVVFADNA